MSCMTNLDCPQGCICMNGRCKPTKDTTYLILGNTFFRRKDDRYGEEKYIVLNDEEKAGFLRLLNSGDKVMKDMADEYFNNIWQSQKTEVITKNV